MSVDKVMTNLEFVNSINPGPTPVPSEFGDLRDSSVDSLGEEQSDGMTVELGPEKNSGIDEPLAEVGHPIVDIE